MSASLDEAYLRLHGTGPEFGGDQQGDHGLANHGPMAAEVLIRHGYGDQVSTWLDRYVARLIDMPPAREPITAQNLRDSLGGGRSRLGDWTEYFTRQMTERPWQDVLARWWPILLPGITAGATHGAIRVGHAVRSLIGGAGELAESELAHGLAFWAARSRPTPGATAPSGDLSPEQALAGIPLLADQSGLLAHRLARLADLPAWPAAQAALRAPADADDVPALLEELVRAATLRYLHHAHGSPILLVHTATAPNAVRHTLPALPKEMWVPSLAAVWSAAAAIVSAYAPDHTVPQAELPEAPRADDPVADLLERAVANGDEHVIKFTDTAVQVYRSSGDPDALAAAVRARELIEPEV
ncbi:questin oxidase family protein [Spongiactinospora rosea]|nr:questin oxidase family protein [Spongiactinospora rosea]